MDFDMLASRLGLDREDFLELVSLFMDTARSDMEKIRNGMLAAAPDVSAAAAHSIKGAAANLGFEEIAALAQTMEYKGKDGSLDGFDTWADQMDVLLDQLSTVTGDADGI